MNINEQELAEAVKTINEGGNAMGINSEDVYRQMLKDENLAMDIMATVNEWNSYVTFEAKFCETAELMLIEAARTHKEQEAGLM